VNEVRITFSNGIMRAVCSDALEAVLAPMGLEFTDQTAPAAGEYTVSRASHVERSVGGWFADMAPVAGPVLGPFPTRQTALDAEVAWLRQNRGL